MTADELCSICLTNNIVVSLAGFIRERDVARLLDVDIRTLARWRADRIGPDAVTIGRTWYYAVAAVAAALTPSDKQRHSTTPNDICSIDDATDRAETAAFSRRAG